MLNNVNLITRQRDNFTRACVAMKECKYTVSTQPKEVEYTLSRSTGDAYEETTKELENDGEATISKIGFSFEYWTDQSKQTGGLPSYALEAKDGSVWFDLVLTGEYIDFYNSIEGTDAQKARITAEHYFTNVILEDLKAG